MPIFNRNRRRADALQEHIEAQCRHDEQERQLIEAQRENAAMRESMGAQIYGEPLTWAEAADEVPIPIEAPSLRPRRPGGFSYEQMSEIWREHVNAIFGGGRRRNTATRKIENISGRITFVGVDKEILYARTD